MTTHRRQDLLPAPFLAVMLALSTLFLGLGNPSQNLTSGGYQLFGSVVHGVADDNPLIALEDFDHFAKVAPECCNAPNRTLGLPSPDYRVPSGYNVTRNADGTATVRGPSGGRYDSTGFYDQSGKPVYRDGNGQYFTLDGGRSRTSAPTDYTSVPIHHVCTNKCSVGSGNNPAWTPRFKQFFDDAKLNINDEINKITVPGHRGPHPQAYHQYVYKQLSDATDGLSPNSSAYTNAVSGTLNRIKTEAVTPGSQINRWLTGG